MKQKIGYIIMLKYSHYEFKDAQRNVKIFVIFFSPYELIKNDYTEKHQNYIL